MPETKNYIVVQPPVSRAESVRAQLADLAWDEGLSAFVTNGVPFSFSSGRVLARGIAHLVDALAHDSGPVRVVELGAGIGYLSAFCLDVLQDDFPSTYAKSSFVITDGSAALVEDAESRGVLSRHGDRAEFSVADLRDRTSILEHGPRLLLLSYLVDAIPPRHLERRDAGVVSARIETRIPADLTVIDGGVWPPEVLGAEEIARRLRSPRERLTPDLGRKIVPFLEESWSWVETSVEEMVGAMLNSRRSLAESLCGLLADMPEESGVLVTDFGYTESDEIELNEMMTEYGLCAFWAVAFDELMEIASSSGFTIALQPGEEGETHTLLIYKGVRHDVMREAFEAGFSEMVSDRPRYVLYNLEEDATLDDVKRAVDQIENTMPEEDVCSYGNLARFAHLFLQFGDVERAVDCARRCVDLYPEVAAPEMTIAGSAEGRAGELGAAEVLFRRAIEVAPGYGNAHFGLAGVFRSRQDWEGYFDCMRNYLRTSDCDAVEAMEGIATTLESTELDHVSREARSWLEMTDGR